MDQKNNQLIHLENRLIKTQSLEEKYALSCQLIDQYRSYASSSTLFYAELCSNIARELGDSARIMEARITHAQYLGISGLNHEALSILNTIDPLRLPVHQQKAYYEAYLIVCYSYITLQNDSYYKNQYLDLAIQKADLFLAIEPEGTVEYLRILFYKLFLEKNYRLAISTIRSLLNTQDITAYTASAAYHYMGMIYLILGENEENQALNAFIRSMIVSNEHAITHFSASAYAGKTLADTNIAYLDKALDYVMVAYDDAIIFGDKPNIDEVRKIHYDIMKIKLEKTKTQLPTLYLSITVTLVFMLCTATTFYFLCLNKRELRNCRRELREVNNRLQHTLQTKEDCIKLFLHRTSDFLSKVERSKNMLIKKLNNGEPRKSVKEDLSLALDTKDDYASLLTYFDNTFLTFFPDFIEKVNSLMKPEQAYPLDQIPRNRLNPELRILAMTRLRVEDNKQIASLLRITVQSLYNYMSKSRSRAINEATFDEDLMKIM